MCGRYVLRRIDALRRAVGFVSPLFEEFTDKPRYNIAPRQCIPLICDQAGQRELTAMKWGLIPFWSKSKPTVMPINAVSETIASKPMFRESFKRRRCLIPADGFYEPKGPKTLNKRQPYFFQRPDKGIFAFAGLWDRWKPDEAPEPVDTCVLLTIGPNDLLRPIHDRMPVILHPDDYDRWLDRDVPGEAVADLLKPAPNNFLETWQVLDMEHDPETNRGIRPGVTDP